MTRIRLLAASLLTVFSVASCAAFKEAMTAHVDVVARAGSQELTVDRLAELMASSDIPLRPDAARTLAQLWINYQLLGHAGAHGDSLGTIEDAQRGMWNAFAQLSTRKYYDVISADWATIDSSAMEQAYNDGELLAAAHILLTKQPEGLSATANDSIRKEAELIADTVTSENFAAVARAVSQDPGSKERGGDYGVFPPGQMVPEFDAGIRSVPPGGITGIVETQYGYHIIRRHTWDEIKDQFAEAYASTAMARGDSLYFAGLEEAANVQVKGSAPRLVKAIAEDVDAYRNDRTVVASSRTIDLTAGRLAEWMAAFPPQSRMRANIIQAPDSLMPMFVMNIMRNEMLLRAADSAGVGADSVETQEIRQAFFNGVRGTMEALNLAPEQLDSAETVQAREQLAASRIEEYLDALMRNETQFISVPEQAAIVLRDKYEARLVTAGLDRALEKATTLRAATDSSAAAAAPSAVPMPTPDSTPQP